MKAFYVSPRAEFLMATGLTVAATQHLFIYLGLLFMAALILPSARMGDKLSFRAGGILPIQKQLIIISLPLSIVVATLDYYEVGNFIENAFSQGSMLTLASAPLKGVLFSFIVSKTFIYSLLRANYALKGVSLFEVFLLIIGVMVFFIPFLTLHFQGHNYGYVVFVTFSNVLSTIIGFGIFSSVFSFFFSIGRR